MVTNVALNVDYGRLENLTLSLELNASASNSLSIAVGTAAGDALTLDEADFEWGYDCGKWFRADTETGNVDEWPEPGNGRVSRTLTINHSDFKPRWNRLRIVKRGVGDVEINASYSSVHEVFYSCEIVNNCDLWKNGFPKKSESSCCAVKRKRVN